VNRRTPEAGRAAFARLKFVESAHASAGTMLASLATEGCTPMTRASARPAEHSGRRKTTCPWSKISDPRKRSETIDTSQACGR
jgi:hypothetical protein